MTDRSAHHAASASAAAGPAARNRFETDMNVGMARMMDDMHSPGFRITRVRSTWRGWS
jgi:hypothetical protein